MERTPSIKDVAALAGVSIKTVSRVINEVASVQPDTRARVEAAIAELNYVPNTIARGLKAGSSAAIGLVIDSIGDVFFASLAHAIEQRAMQNGLGVVVASTGFDTEREIDQLMRMTGQRMRGIILAPVSGSYPYLESYRSQMPVVMVDRASEGFDSVIVDDEGATREAVAHLADFGHTRIAFVGKDNRYQTMVRRFEGYLAVLAERGIEPDPDLIPETGSETEAARNAIPLLLARRNPPTAVFCSNSRTAIGVVTALHALGRADVAVISFGDFLMSDVLNPGLSYISQDPYAIGETAFDHLMALIENPAAEARQIVIPTELRECGSGEIRAAHASEGAHV